MGIQTFTRRSPTKVSSINGNTATDAISNGTNEEGRMKWGGRSDFSRPSISSTATATATATATVFANPTSNSSTMVIEQQPIEEEKISQPRFSRFGKKPKFTTIKSIIEEEAAASVNIPPPPQEPQEPHIKSPAGNSIAALVEEQLEQQQQQQQQQVEEPKRIICSAPKFELHLSTKSAANHKEDQEEKKLQKELKEQQPQDITQISPTKTKRRSGVKFHPVFLEQVALFRESQPANQVAEAHNKSPNFRIICPSTCWHPIETNDYHEKNIIVTKKSFFVTKDNSQIKGKLMIRNLALDKSVSIRYTFDSWTTVRDVDGVFFGPNPKNIAFDIYEFAMSLDEVADHGELRAKIEFAIRFTAGDDDYWDNNQGRNYQIKVIADPLNDPWKVEKEQQAHNGKEGQQVQEEDEDDDEYLDDEDDEELQELEEEEEEKHNSFTNALKGYKHAKPFHLNNRQPWLGTRYDFGQSLQLAKRAPYESWSATVKADPTLITEYFLVKPISIKPTFPPPLLEQQPTPSSSLTTTTTKPTTSSLAVSFSNYPKVSEPPQPTPIKITPPPPPSYSGSYSSTSFLSPTATKPIPFTLSTSATTNINSAPPSPRTSPKLASVSPSPPPLSAPPVTRPSLHHSYTSPANGLNASSPLDINSSYYLDLVNKYCFYNGTSNGGQYDDTLLPIS